MLRHLLDLGNAVGITTTYVASMYALAGTDDNSRRNETAVILKRLGASSVVTVLLGLWPLVTKFHRGEASNSAAAALLSTDAALAFVGSADVRSRFAGAVLLQNGARVARLFFTLFAGVLLEWLVHYAARIKRRLSSPPAAVGATQKQEDDSDDEDAMPSSIPARLVRCARDFALAPMTEEVVFRGAIQQCCIGGMPIGGAARVLLSALVFAAAHAHHAVSLWPVPRVNVPRLVQHMVPPLLFGLVGGACVEQRDGGAGLLPLTAAHGFCNLVGPPKWRAVVINDPVVRAHLPLLATAHADRLFIAVHVACVAAFAYQLW